MQFDREAFCNSLKRTDTDASLAIREARKAIPQSLPILPDIYAVYRDSNSHALACLAFQTILCFESHAIPFLLQLLGSPSNTERCDAISLLVGRCQSVSHLMTGYLYARPATLPDFGILLPIILSRLLEATKDSVRDVRVRAATALDDLHAAPCDVVELLVDGLESNEPIIRKLASLYLGRLECIAVRALPTLKKHVLWDGVDDGTVYPLRATKTAIWRIENTEPSDAPQPRNDAF